MTVNIGGISVRNPLFLAPMAGVTISAVRRLFMRLGVGLTHTEMVSSIGLLHGSNNTFRMLGSTPEEQPLVLQLFSGDPDSLSRSAEYVLKRYSFAALGINMACPMPKVTKRGAGSKLLENPETAALMVAELKKFGLPVWPKIRKIIPDGKRYPLDTVGFTGMLLNAGADNVTIHGRTATQRYEGISDIEEILKAARTYAGKITASGDIFSLDTIKRCLSGGCTAVMLARGVISDPFLPLRAEAILGYNNEVILRPLTIEERLTILINFARELEEFHNPRIATVLTKRFLPGFLREMPGSMEFRRIIAVSNDWEKLYSTLQDWQHYLKGE